MRLSVIPGILAVLALLAVAAGPVLADELSRRGVLGLRVSTEAEGPVKVLELQPGGAGAQAGVVVGDVIAAVGDGKVGNLADFSKTAARLVAGRPVPLAVIRANAPQQLTIVPQERPRETLENAQVLYGEAAIASGARVRTLTTLPKSDRLKRGGRAPGVLLIQGMPCVSIETLGDESHPYTRLITRLNDAGFATLRVEKPGEGDSEGVPCADGGFNREVEALDAALGIFQTRGDIDPKRLYAIGISMGGGIQAPLVARSHQLAGIVTFGTGVQPWFDYTINNFRERWLLQGRDPHKIDTTMRLWRRYFAQLLIMDRTPAQIAASDANLVAALRPILGDDLDRFAGRHYTFHQELDDQDVMSAWAAYKGDVLSVHGEYDWVASRDDDRLIPKLVARNGGEVRWEVIRGMDHGFTVHDSLEASIRNPFRGKPSEEFYKMAVDWLKDEAEAKPKD